MVEREKPDSCFSISRCRAWTASKSCSAARPERGAAGRDDLRPRHRQHGGGGDQARRVRLHREAAANDRVLVTVAQRARPASAARENRQLKKAVEVGHQLVGDSAALKQALDAVERAAPTKATVLILGESGVGKELVARAIHRNSLRARERFVQVNCAAIPEELIESELFGHEKGSFTGATEKQIGKFEQADRGTIFLDEVGDMSAEDAGQGAPRPAGRRSRAARVGADDQGGRARHRGDQQESRGGSRAGQLPRRPLLSAERDSDLRAAAPRASRGRPRAGAAFPGLVPPREQPAAEEGQPGGDRGVAALPVAAATSASCGIRSSGWSS